MDSIPPIVTIVLGIIGPTGAAWVGVRVALNGTREAVRGLHRDMRELRDDVQDVRERVARLEGT